MKRHKRIQHGGQRKHHGRHCAEVRQCAECGEAQCRHTPRGTWRYAGNANTRIRLNA